MSPKLNLPLGYALVSLHYNGTSVPNGATVTFGVSADPASLTPVQVATVVKNALRAAGGPYNTSTTLHGSGIILQDVHVKFGPMETGPEGSVADGGVIGNAPNEPVAPNTAYLVTKSTLSGGRRGRGRMFLPGLQEVTVSGGGQIASGTLTSLQTSWSQFFNQIDAGLAGMVLLHNYDTAKGQLPQTPSTVTSLQVAGLMATQRNRMRR